MRVLTVGNMYPPHHLGGYELVWRGAVLHLRDRGHEVRVLTTDYRSPRPDPHLAEDPDVHRELRWYWRDHEFPRLGLRERLKLERHNLEALEHHLHELSPDVVGWWGMGGMSMSMIELVRRRGIPARGFVHDDWMLYGPRVDAWQRVARRCGPLAGLLERTTGVPARLDLRSAATWVFVSETTRERSLAEHRLPRTAVAHSGIDLSLLPRAPAKPWRGRLLYVGRLDPRKGVHTAVRAVALLPHTGLAILGVGDERYEQELRALIGELGVQDRVSFGHLGRDQIGKVYADADAVLFPAVWDEPWGLVPLEAMAVGAAVIATGAGGSSEYLRDEENCLIFRPRDDPRALARAIERVAGDPALRDRLREGGFETAPRYTENAFNAAVAATLEEAARR